MLAHRLFGAARGRSVVVGQVEVGDAVVEGVATEPTAVVEAHCGAKVRPQPETDAGQHHATAAAAGIGHAALVATGRRLVGCIHG